MLAGLTLADKVGAQAIDQRDFDAVQVGYDFFGANAHGSSNGVGWAMCNTYFSSCCEASTSETYTGFGTADFSPPVAHEDNLHTTGRDFALVFERRVKRVVVYLRENGGSASLDLGLTPIVLSGSGNLSIVGTRILPNTSGGSVAFDNIGSRILTHTAAAFDGMNVAFYVEALEPGAGPLTGDGSNLCATLGNLPPTADAGGPYAVPEGGSETLMGSGDDPDGNALSYAWDLDDNGSFETPGQNVSFSAVGRDGPDSQAVVLRVCDTSDECATDEGTVQITNEDPIISAVDNGGPVEEGDVVAVTVSAGDPAGAADPLSYAFDCDDDGTYEVGPQAANVGTCQFDDDGSYEVPVRVTDGDGGAASGSTAIEVGNAAPEVTSLDLTPAAIYEDGSVIVHGSFSDDGPLDSHTVRIDWGDGGPTTAAAVTQGTGGGSFTASHQYLDDNPSATFSDLQAIEVTVTDDDDGSGDASTTATVTNLAPAITEITVPVGPQPLGTLGISAPFTDAGTLDTHTCTIDWDDGAGPVSASVSDDPGNGTCSAAHNFTSAGVHAVTVTVTDDDTGSASLTSTDLIVVFDPSAGFVTGGGWYNSLAGSDRLYPQTVGKANFGFVAKYRAGASTPEGQTEFQFKAGDLNFHSSEYEWLVVTGGCMAQYKGTGTVNGVAEYTFMLTLRDGGRCSSPTTDGVRMKIMGPDGLRYDTRFGDGDDIGPQAGSVQAINGGSIVIHW
jgi:hypothetical protein